MEYIDPFEQDKYAVLDDSGNYDYTDNPYDRHPHSTYNDRDYDTYGGSDRTGQRRNPSYPSIYGKEGDIMLQEPSNRLENHKLVEDEP